MFLSLFILIIMILINLYLVYKIINLNSVKKEIINDLTELSTENHSLRNNLFGLKGLIEVAFKDIKALDETQLKVIEIVKEMK